MALVTIEGTYEDEKIVLAELPKGLERARVVVTFLPDENAARNGNSDAEDNAKQRRHESGKRLVSLLEKGAHLGGPPYLSREDLYDRTSDNGK